VVRIAPGSPAERAGLRGIDFGSGALGDIIVGANNKPVRRLADLTDQLEELGVGKTVRLTLQRNGRERTVDLDVIDVGRTS